MRAFKYALRVVAAHPAYLVVYAVVLSLMGVFLAGALTTGDDPAYEPARPAVAVVDRGGGELAEGLRAFLAEGCDLVAVDDEPFALQDAVARGEAACVVVVPAGYTEAFLDAARAGGDAPVLEVAYSFDSLAGTLASSEVDQYLGLVRAAAVLQPDAPAVELARRAAQAGEERAEVETVTPPGGTAVGSSLVFYLKWCSYTLTAAVVVSVGVLMGAFNRTDLRRRSIVSPVSSLTLGLHEAGAALVVALGVVALMLGLGWAAFGGSVAALPPETLGLMVLDAVALALVPLSLGFLMGQLGANEMVVNAVGNILGMVLAFLGGAWVPLSLMPEVVATLARFTPVYWYTDALDRCAYLTDPTAEALGAVLGDIGLVALFAAVVFVAALAAGRLRVQSAAAGGNAAAALPTT